MASLTLDSVSLALKAADFESNIESALSSYDGSDPGLVKRTVAWVVNLRDDFIRLLEQIDDAEQIGATLAIHYIEIKSHWIALNTKMNYQMARSGSAELETVFRGSAISQFLAALEPMIGQGDVDAITDFLSKPITGESWTAQAA